MTTLPPAPIRDPWGSYTWEEWLRKVSQIGQSTGSVSWSGIDFTGSSLTNIVDRKHNDLSNMQGGTSAEYYHMTSAEYTLFQRNTTIEYSVPLTGFSTTIANGTGFFIVNPAGTLATGTITMPATPVDKQQVTISSTQVITALTHNPNSGQTLKGALTTIAANGSAAWIYRSTDTTWYRIR